MAVALWVLRLRVGAHTWCGAQERGQSLAGHMVPPWKQVNTSLQSPVPLFFVYFDHSTQHTKLYLEVYLQACGPIFTGELLTFFSYMRFYYYLISLTKNYANNCKHNHHDFIMPRNQLQNQSINDNSKFSNIKCL